MGFSRQEYWSGVPLPSPGVVCIEGFIPFILAWIMSFSKHCSFLNYLECSKLAAFIC